MKNKIVICICMAYAGMSTALVMSHEESGNLFHCHNENDYTVINLTSMTAEQLREFFKGETVHVVLECPEGTSLPLNLSLNGEFLALEPLDHAPYTMKILKTCFIRFAEEGFVFSDDCIQWKEFLEFFSGKVGVGMNEESTEVYLNFELNQR